jgi:hypothetical protein
MKDKVFRVKRNIIITQVKDVVAKTANQANQMVDYQDDNGWTNLESSKKISWNHQNIDLIVRLEGTDE